MNEPRIRIIVLNYNSSRTTLALLNSLLNQSYTNFEIVVVDNCSEKLEYDILKEGLPNGVYLVDSPKNEGYSRGNNIGMRFITEIIPDFYLVLNSDLVIENCQLLSILVSTFVLDDSQLLMAVSPLVNTLSVTSDVAYQYQVRRLLSPLQMILVHLSFLKPFVGSLLAHYMYSDKMPFRGKITLCDSINGAAFIVRYSVMENLGFLDPGTFLYMEELILGKQIQNLGGVCGLNGYCEVKHYQGLSTGSRVKLFNSGMEHFKRESFVYFLRKYYGISKYNLYLFNLLKRFDIFLKTVMTKL